MPDGRPAPARPRDDLPVEPSREAFLRLLEEGLEDVRAGRVHTLDEARRMIADAFAEQDGERDDATNARTRR